MTSMVVPYKSDRSAAGSPSRVRKPEGQYHTERTRIVERRETNLGVDLHALLENTTDAAIYTNGMG